MTRMSGQHVYRTGNQWGITVRELINKIAEEGSALRLNWRTDAPVQTRRSASDPAIEEDYPTGVLPMTLLRELEEFAKGA